MKFSIHVAQDQIFISSYIDGKFVPTNGYKLTYSRVKRLCNSLRKVLKNIEVGWTIILNTKSGICKEIEFDWMTDHSRPGGRGIIRLDVTYKDPFGLRTIFDIQTAMNLLQTLEFVNDIVVVNLVMGS